MGHGSFSAQMNLTSDLLHHLPFSPSLPSFRIVAIGEDSKRIVGRDELVNRENLLFRLNALK